MNGNGPVPAKSKRSSRGSANDAKSRNWRFLFDNLTRAVGDIYAMCEQDGDIEECKEAIMVLHNRIKEFEGLIQYIEVQASYETSEERPSSVAWEVPVSSIKQPSLPFHTNGDSQLYYYPCLPQAYQQYPMPGSFPMMDPNMMNFMYYNQQMQGFAPDFMNQSGNPQAIPQNFHQYSSVPDYNNNVNKKSYSKQTRSSGKQRSADLIPSRSLNSLDVDPSQPEFYEKTIEHRETSTKCEKVLITESSKLDLVNVSSISQSTEMSHFCEGESFSTSKVDFIKKSGSNLWDDALAPANSNVIGNLANDAESPTKKVETKESDAASQTEDKGHFDLVESAIADAIDDKSSNDESSPTKTANRTQEWFPVSASSSDQGFIHVSVDVSEQSLPVTPEASENTENNEEEGAEGIQSDSEAEPTTHVTDSQTANKTIPLTKDEATESTDINSNVISETSKDENKTPVQVSNKSSKKVSEVQNNPVSSVKSRDITKAEVKAVAKSEDDSVTEEILPRVEVTAKTHITDLEDEKDEVENQILKATATEPAISDPKTVSCSELNINSKKLPEFTEMYSSVSGANFKPSDVSSGAKPVLVAKPKSLVNPSSTTPEPQVIKRTRSKESRASTCSELIEGEPKEVDVLSESGLSTMSSGSVQSCMSLPPNPLARSTSWADLVRKGKSESPVPVSARKMTAAARYSSTPSRYMAHTQRGSHHQAALSKSKSVPSQRDLQGRVTPVRPDRNVPHVGEDGWSVSSGKSRVKTVPSTVKRPDRTVLSSSLAKPDSTKSPANSPRLSVRSSNNKVATDCKSKPEIGPRTKSNDLIEKPKTAKTLRSRSVVGPSKSVQSKVSSTAVKQTVSKPSLTGTVKTTKSTKTSSRLISKPISSKPIVKAKSVESSSIKPSNKLKSKKGVSKSSDPIDTKTSPKSTRKREDTKSEAKSEESPPPKELDTPELEITDPLSQSATTSSDSITDLSETSKPASCDESEKLQSILSENKYIQTERASDDMEMYAVPASSLYPRPNFESEEENCGYYRVLITKRKRQISEHSSISNDTLDESEERDSTCLSPGCSPGRNTRSSGGGRSPGKAPQLHQRLSSPSRRRNPTDTVLKNYQERLAKAQVLRDKIHEEKANKLKKIKIKEEQIKDLQSQQEKERQSRAVSHAEKLARAERLREKKIAEVKRKAQEEDQKVNEITFINTLEAQNRKMELLSKEQVAESKRVEIQVRQQEERKRRSEELQAKEDAVQERKMAIEADRLARIAYIQDKITESQAKVDLNKLEMELAAREAAKEKSRERDIMVSLVKHDRNSSDTKPLKHKGRQQETSQLVELQERAAMLCQHASYDYMPAHTLYQPPKWCSKCNLKIVSEAVLMSHMIKRHQKSSQSEAEVEGRYIVDYSEADVCPVAQDVITRQKMLRKRSKKVKTRLANKISELPAVKLLEPLKECPNKNRLYKCIKAMGNSKNRDKGVCDLSRTVLTKTDVNHLIDKGVIEQICKILPERQLLAPVSKLLLHCCSFSSTASALCARWLPDLIEILDSEPALTLTPASRCDITRLTANLLRTFTPCESVTSDVVSYLVCREIIDTLQSSCTNTYHTKDEVHCSALMSTLELLSSACAAMTSPHAPLSTTPTKNDPSQLVETLMFTKACNLVTFLYGVLLYAGPPRNPAPPLTDLTRRVVLQSLDTLLHIARFSLNTLQSVLESEGMLLELRHVFSYILCSAPVHNYQLILDKCVQLIGYVVFNHHSNQMMLQNGPSPSLLQLLTALPFSYFSDIKSMNLLFPTLISACNNCPSNLAILQQKVSKIMLISYLKENLQDCKDKHIQFYPRAVFQQALKFLESPAPEPCGNT